MQIFALRSFVDDEHVTLQSGKVAVTYAVQTQAGGSTRLHVRVRFAGPRPFGWTLALVDLVMMRKQLLTLRELAEQEVATSRS